MYYAIQIIGYGKRQRFIISQVIPGKGTNPTNGKNYPTEEAAREAEKGMHMALGTQIAWSCTRPKLH